MHLKLVVAEPPESGVDQTEIDRKLFTYKVNVAIGRSIRTARNLRKITQTDLANRLDVSFQQVQKYENGTNRIPLSALLLISLALDVSIPELFADIADNFEMFVMSGQEKRVLKAFRALGVQAG